MRRLLLTGVLVLAGVLCLMAGTVSATGGSGYEAYVAKPGDTIASIAAEYGIAADDLARYNRLGVNDPLPAGQLVLVPDAPPPVVTRPEQAREVEATTPDGNTVQGRLGAVVVPKATIHAQPGPGKTLFDNAARGTQLLVLGYAGDYYALLMADGSTGFILKSQVGLTERTMSVAKPAPAPKASTNSPYIDTALEYMGTPYKLGGRLPDSVDCSLLVQTVFRRHGVRLPRTAAQQYNVGQPVQVADLQPGDRLYFYNRAGNIGHTGLYMGNGRFVHASSNQGMVAIDNLADPTYWNKYAGARR